MLEDMKITRELTARHDNNKLSAEFRKAFPTDRYTVEDHRLEEEGGSEVLKAVAVSTTDNKQDETKVLIYCKPYVAPLKTGKLECDKNGDQLFDFVGEAMEMMDGGNYKGALLLLPEKTFLPRHLAEMLQQKGDIFTLRHTDRFVSDVREEVNKLLKDGEEEEEEGPDEPERTTPINGQAHLLEVSPGELVLITGDEDRREHDKVDPRTPQTKSEGSSVRSKVNRKLYPELPESPTEDRSPDTRSTTTWREAKPEEKDGTRDVRSKADDKAAHDKEQPPTRSPCVPTSSRHPKKDRAPDQRSKETEPTVPKVSSSTATTAVVSSAAHVKKDGKLEMRYKENKMAAGLHGLKMDGSPDMRFKGGKQNNDASRIASVLKCTTPTTTAPVPFQRDNKANETAPSPCVSTDDDDGCGDGSPNTRSTTTVREIKLKKEDGTCDVRSKTDQEACDKERTPTKSPCPSKYPPSRHPKKDRTPDQRSKETEPTVPKVSSCTATTALVSGAVHVKKDGTPEMRYKENKIAAGLQGLKVDGSPDMRFKGGKQNNDASRIASVIDCTTPTASATFGDGFPNTRSTTTVRETNQKKIDGTRDVRSKPDKAAYDKEQTPTKSPSSRHPKKDGTPDQRSKVSSSTATTALASSAVHVKKDGTPDMRFKENKIAAGLPGLKMDGTPDMRFKKDKQNNDASKFTSVLERTTPTTTASAPFQRDDKADKTAPSPCVFTNDDDGYDNALSTSSCRGSYPAGPLKKDGTPDMRFKENKIAGGLHGLKLDGTPDMRFQEGKQNYDASKITSVLDFTTPITTASAPFQWDDWADETASSPYVSKDDDGYDGESFTSGFRGRYPAGPLKKDGTPDMRFKENKIAAGLYGWKMDGTPDMRFQENIEQNCDSFRIASVLDYPTSITTAAPFHRDNRAGDTSLSPCVSTVDNDGYGGGLFTSGFRGSYPTGPLKKDGTPDMRYKANKIAAGLYGLKMDGTPDMRFEENKIADGLYGLKMDGTPDMRFKENKIADGLYGLKMDGTPDMRFKQKIAAGLYGLRKDGSPYTRLKKRIQLNGSPYVRLKKRFMDGTPDMRFQEGKQHYDVSRITSVLDCTTPMETASAPFQRDDWEDETTPSPYVSKDDDGYGGELFTSGFRGSYSAGPLKKDGTPDMRYKANKIAAGLYGLKMDGTPDMRFKENKIAAGLYGLKKDGTPDMRFKENKTTYGSSSYSPSYSSGYSSGHSPSCSSGYSPSYSSGYSSSYSPSYSAGPLKKDGTPDMRYKANKIACGMYGYKKDGTPDMRFKENKTTYGSSSYSPSYSSGYSSGYSPSCSSGYSPSYSSGYSSSYSAGPLKKDGTPDMRYKANKIACGMYGYKKDGTPDRRFKANRR
ncbi:uncharacterized protein [Branchiostoma lanceolatum]|uniref:uncharacterized protein n=1 Tax=Branchiostoma lanceolatum TaxID=7740 RepID=UPI0034571AD9